MTVDWCPLLTGHVNQINARLHCECDCHLSPKLWQPWHARSGLFVLGCCSCCWLVVNMCVLTVVMRLHVEYTQKNEPRIFFFFLFSSSHIQFHFITDGTESLWNWLPISRPLEPVFLWLSSFSQTRLSLLHLHSEALLCECPEITLSILEARPASLSHCHRPLEVTRLSTDLTHPTVLEWSTKPLCLAWHCCMGEWQKPICPKVDGGQKEGGRESQGGARA